MNNNTITNSIISSGAKSEISKSSDYSMFLKMLTTQLQNQDPLNPQQSTEFAAQLATFSGVEQQVRTNEQLATLTDRLGVSNISQLASWIGMEVRSEAPLDYIGDSVTLYPRLPTTADSAEVSVVDQYGRLQDTFTILASQQSLDYSGLMTNGDNLPPGRYTFQVTALRAGEAVGTGGMQHYATVVEASNDLQGGTTLTLSGGATLSSSQAMALRRP